MKCQQIVLQLIDGAVLRAIERSRPDWGRNSEPAHVLRNNQLKKNSFTLTVSIWFVFIILSLQFTCEDLGQSGNEVWCPHRLELFSQWLRGGNKMLESGPGEDQRFTVGPLYLFLNNVILEGLKVKLLLLCIVMSQLRWSMHRIKIKTPSFWRFS